MLSRRCAKAACLIGWIMLAMLDSRVGAVTYYFAVDVPATLGGTEYTIEQLVRSDNATYVLAAALPTGAQLSALHRRSDGMWLFAPTHPITVGGTDYEPRDIVSFDGASFAGVLDGSLAGIPDYARIDSLFVNAGDLVLSFDVPVNLGGAEYSRSDLVRFSAAGFSLHWDAESAGVPPDGNVVGADRDSSGTLVVSFDVPTNVGGTEFLPGQLVRWNGGTSFSSYFIDNAWPLSAQLRDFSFVPAPGTVPDGGTFPGVPLTVDASGGQLVLSWGTSCARTESDYEIYEGTLGSYYSHTQIFCTTGGATTKTLAQPAGSTYYLVVPKNADKEGSYGRSSGGAEIPQGASACLPQQIALSCP